MNENLRRHARTQIVAFTLCAVAAVGLHAETNTVRSISLSECLALALTNNLDLQIERINPRMARYDLEIARAGYDPAFQFSGEHGHEVTGNAGGETRTDSDSFRSSLSGLGPMGLSYSLGGEVTASSGISPGAPFDVFKGSVGLSLTQPLLKNFVIDETRYKIAAARNQLKVSELSLRQQVITVMTAVEQDYFDLIYAAENVRVQEESVRLAQRLLEDNRRRVTVGTLARLDEKQSESQLATRQTELSIARQALATAQNNLKKRLTGSYRTLRVVELVPGEKMSATPLALDLQTSWQMGLTQRPDVLQARLDVERQGLTLKYLKNQELPELDLAGSYGHGASGDREYGGVFSELGSGDKPFWSLSARLTIPLGNKTARARYHQGRASVEHLLLSLKQQEERVLVEIDEAVNAVRASFDRVHSTHEARLYAEEALEAEQRRLNSGSSTSFVVLQLQRELTSARSVEIGALADYNKAVAALSSAEGSTLSRNNITMEIK